MKSIVGYSLRVPSSQDGYAYDVTYLPCDGSWAIVSDDGSEKQGWALLLHGVFEATKLPPQTEFQIWGNNNNGSKWETEWMPVGKYGDLPIHLSILQGHDQNGTPYFDLS